MPAPSDEQVADILLAWGALYGRVVKEKSIDVWLKIFRTTDPYVLSKALDKVTAGATRMPTPGDVTKAITLVYDEGALMRPAKREADPLCTVCKGTGYKTVPVRRDVDPTDTDEAFPYKQAVRCDCRTEDGTEMLRRGKEERLEPVIVLDEDSGEKVVAMQDPKTGERFFRATDCPEGRAFINMLHKVAGHASVPFPKRKGKSDKELERERQRQKIAYENYLKKGKAATK